LAGATIPRKSPKRETNTLNRAATLYGFRYRALVRMQAIIFNFESLSRTRKVVAAIADKFTQSASCLLWAVAQRAILDIQR
jgi:hypothetical protein